MRTRQRLLGLKKWFADNLCKGRSLKAPGEGMDITKVVHREPVCYVAWPPMQLKGNSILMEPEFSSVCPSIVLMPALSDGKLMEEKRFDSYDAKRPQELGQTLAISVLFSVYEPGIRLPGFVESASSGKGMDMSLLLEGTEEGLFTLTDWMDDCRELLLGAKSIPGTDLFLQEDSIRYSLYTDQSYVVDKRPIFYGFTSLTFYCHANERSSSIDEYLL